jgi:ParB-like chromosome segregation protein Spo0J
METKKFRLIDINPAPYNPRKDLQPGDAQYEAIKNSIERFGFVEPLIVNVRDGGNVLVGGHQRYKILLAQGVQEVEAVVVDLPENEEKALNVGLNKIEGEWDYGKLKDLVAELDRDDVTSIGFSKEEVDSLLQELEQESGGEDVADDPGEVRDGTGDEEGDDDTGENENTAEKPFEVYLSFPTQAAAESWLEAHGIDKAFDSSRNVILDFTKEAQEA